MFTSLTRPKYFNIMGWKKIRTKYCQFVSRKNRIERLIYADFCLSINYTYDCTIFIDESTVQASKNAHRRWYKPGLEGETRIGLVEKYTHPYSVHVIGGISRLGATELIVFKGTLCID